MSIRPDVFSDSRDAPRPVPVHCVSRDTWPAVRGSLGARNAAFAEAVGFEPVPGRHLVLPDADGGVGAVLCGIDRPGTPHVDRFVTGRLPTVLPAGTYAFATPPADARLATLAWALGSYRFSRYRTAETRQPLLVPPAGVDIADIRRIADGVALARDLVNTPANDLGPAELETAARGLAARHGAEVRAVTGDALLAANLPLIHAVGRASPRPPRLVEILWGDPGAPRIALVGKGVVFDTGGLDLKPDTAMLLMKKDMGGAAAALACAHMIMDRGLRVRLQVLLPIVENAVSGSAFRPGDVYRTRKGLTVEIGNTDAEGRLILADAITLADEESPALIADFATLTGAARVALGPDMPPFYTDDDAFAADLGRHAMAENDPLWRMPLWRPYDAMLDSKIADLNNVSGGPHAGSITAALFLRRFVERALTHVHVDLFAWTPSARPGRPEGGECQAARALYALLAERYG